MVRRVGKVFGRGPTTFPVREHAHGGKNLSREERIQAGDEKGEVTPQECRKPRLGDLSVKGRQEPRSGGKSEKEAKPPCRERKRGRKKKGHSFRKRKNDQNCHGGNKKSEPDWRGSGFRLRVIC